MVKLVDMPDLGSGAARRVGSSPIIRTKSSNESLDFFLFTYFQSNHQFSLLITPMASLQTLKLFDERS